jgi:hypothetical protein
MSFDTVILKKPFGPFDTGYWHDTGFKRAKNGRLALNGEGTTMTVFQKGYGGKDWLTVQASLPKILYGHNATLPTERQAREAANWLCEFVSNATRLTFTVEDSKAFRVDYTRDFDICEDRARTITLALLPTDLPDFPKVNREHDSVTFVKKRGREVTKQIVVYPKFTWATDTNQPQNVFALTRGKLRLEVRVMRKGLTAIKGAIKPLDYLSQSISDSLLNEAAKMLDLQRIINARNYDFQGKLIVHAYGQRSLGKLGLMGFIELVERYGENFYQKPDFHYPKSTYYKLRGELKELELWDQIVAASKVQSAYE